MNNNEKRRQEIRDLLWSKSIELFWILVICSAVLVTILGMTAKARSQPLQAPPLPQAPPIIPEHIIPAVQLAQAPPIIEQPPVAPPSNGASATIRVTVNENALIWFDGVITSSTGADREFVTPPITRPGIYKLKIRNGTRETIRDVTVRPGDDITIDLRNGSPRATGARSGETMGGISTERPPFAQSSGVAPLLTADHDDDGRGPWPTSIPFPDGLIRYRPAQYTQEIAVTNGRDRISPVHRSRLKSKWHQSGGMEGVIGYKSDVYKLLPSEPRTYIGNIAVWNGSNDQNNRGWKREYANGTKFFDVLSNTVTGKVFEHRQAEKRNGVWTRKVIFSDHAERPAGYVGLSQSCASCHDSFPGSGNYAGPLVSGSDTIFSDSFPALERH